MKKLIGILICLLLISSIVPFAFALEDSTAKGMEFANDKAREKYMDARENYKEALKKREAAREKFIELKEELKDCKDDESEECEQTRADALDEAKILLLSAIDTLKEHFNKLQARAEGKHSDIVRRFDYALDKLDNLEGQVKSAENKKEIKEVALEIRKFWKGFKKTSEKHAGRIAINRFKRFTERIESMIKRLQHAKEKLESQGKDILVIERALSELESSLKKTNSKIDEAKEEYEAGTVRTGNIILRDAHEQLQLIHRKITNTLRVILSKGTRIKELRKVREISDEKEEREQREEKEEITENEEDKNSKDLAVQAREDADQAIDSAQDAILDAIELGDDPGDAQDKLEKARESFRKGDSAKAKRRYALAKESYEEAKEYAEDAENLL